MRLEKVGISNVLLCVDNQGLQIGSLNVLRVMDVVVVKFVGWITTVFILGVTMAMATADLLSHGFPESAESIATTACWRTALSCAVVDAVIAAIGGVAR